MSLPFLVDERCAVVAEISNAHNGRKEHALALIEQAVAVGVDAIKFQAYTPEELVALRGDGPAPDPWGTEGWTMRALYQRARTPFSWFPDLLARCRELDVPWFASVFGETSLTIMDLHGCSAYKVASLEARQRKLLAMIRATGKPVVRSLPLKRPPMAEPTDTLLYCPPGYPQPTIDMRIAKRYDGLSYHGTNPLVPLFAATQGAAVIEVHVQADDEPSELESDVCLTFRQIKQLVDSIGTLTREER